MAQRIQPALDTFRGINNKLNPCSAQYRQGMAYDAQNSRINESGLWDKAAQLTAASMGSVAARGLPVTLSNLVAHWKMNDDAASQVVINSVNTDDNGATSVNNTEDLTDTGVINECLDLGGTDYITVGDDDKFSFAGDTAFSLAADVYVTDAAARTIIAKANSTTAGEWILRMTSAEQIEFYVIDDSESAWLKRRCSVLAVGWHHVVATYDGSAVVAGLNIYIDGVLDNEAIGSTGSYAGMEAGALDVVIGAESDGGSTWPDKIDNVMIFNKELSGNEVSYLYNGGDRTEDIESVIHTHFADCTIDGTHIIAKYLKGDSHINVGPNKYAYVVDDDLGSARAPYWWDGTDKATAAAFVDNVTAANYAVAGLDRPTAADGAFSSLNITAADNSNSNYGGRMEQGTYYYMYTFYDEERKVESLPSDVRDWTAGARGAGGGSQGQDSVEFPSILVVADANHASRYDPNTKIRFYRSKRTYEPDNDINPPNELYYLGEQPYDVDIANLTYDHSGGSIDRKLAGSTSDFARIIVGDYIHLSANGGVAEGVYTVAAIDTTNYAFVGLQADAGLTNDGTVTGHFRAFNDYAHDKELFEMYEGRGSKPPTDIDCLASFNNRMYYFKDNVAYWSSAGRPEEVAQEYKLVYELTNPNIAGNNIQTTKMPMQPILYGGEVGEAKYEISELEGETVIAAYPLDNKLWIWTESTTGYLKPSNATEGVKYWLVRKGVGIISNKTLAHTPYGLFGADREGIWQIDNYKVVRRISKGIIDIDTSTKSTYCKQSSLDESFGVWVADLDEYWWCVANDSETTIHRQIAYHPIRRIFNGIYAYPNLTGGCAFISSGGAQVYLTGAKTAGDSAVEALVQTIQFWMGQHDLGTVKDQVKIEIIYESITADKDVTLTVYQNNIASTTGAAIFSGTTHDDDNLVGTISPKSSGRMFLVNISVPSDCQAPIVHIGYIVNEILWSEKAGR